MSCFDKVLVANRGEIAVRVLRTLRELGIRSVAIYSEADAGSPHVRYADEAYLVGPPPAAASYLDVEAVLDVCQRSGCDALHPGYGFLAENAAFAAACADAGVTFVGPTPEAIEAMGSKLRARALVRALGVPIVPGSDRAVRTLSDAREIAHDLGYPVAVKASGGGGGIGLRVARNEPQLEQALETARADGTRFFGDSEVYLERYFDDPRHVEIQILGDRHGTIVHLGERDCTIQRRHQKLVEETPSPAADDALRRTLAERALTIARHVRYTSAGTIEGLLADGEFYFLEMNTRLQVEHTVTELTTGVDLVREQLQVAAGLPLTLEQADVAGRGVAIECRVNAESAARLFAPSPGTIERYVEPGGPGVRVDSGVECGTVVSPFYDSLLAKLVVWDVDREAATARMLRALGEYEIDGVETLVPFHRRLLETEQWACGESARDLLADRAWLRATGERDGEPAVETGGRSSARA